MKKASFYLTSLMAVVSIVCGFASCQSDKKNQDITQVKYYVRYDASDGSIKAEAAFRRDTAFVALDGRVLFLNKDMQSLTLRNGLVRYQYNGVDSALHKNFEFRFSDHGRDFTHTGVITPIAGFKMWGIDMNRTQPTPANEDIASKSAGLSIQLPNELTKDESLVTLITDSKGKSMSITFVGNSTNVVYLLPPQFATLTEGPAKIYLVRKKTLQIRDANAPAASMNLELYSKEVSVTIAL